MEMGSSKRMFEVRVDISVDGSNDLVADDWSKGILSIGMPFTVHCRLTW